MTLTAAQKKRLAAEARRLADRIATRGPPRTLESATWRGCGIGHVIRGAGLGEPESPFVIHNYLDHLVEPCFISAATLAEMRTPGALVFPLLALADALDP